MRHGFAADDEGAGEVHRHEAVEYVGGEFVQVVEAGDACYVHHYVQLAEGVDGALHQCLAGGFVHGVEGNCLADAASGIDFCCGGLVAGFVDVPQQYFGAFGCQSQCGGFAHAGCGASDQCHFVFETFHLVILQIFFTVPISGLVERGLQFRTRREPIPGGCSATSMSQTVRN